MSRSLLGAVVLCAAFVSAGCDDSPPNAPTAPTLPTVPVVTENFSATLNINGAATYPFVVGTAGDVSARLVSVSPEETLIGMSLGTWNTTTETCQTIISSDLTVVGRTIFGIAQTSGAFCVRVYDVGRLTAPTAYEVEVKHQ